MCSIMRLFFGGRLGGTRCPERVGMGPSHRLGDKPIHLNFRQMLERIVQDRRLKSAALFLIKPLAVLAAVSESITEDPRSARFVCSRN